MVVHPRQGRLAHAAWKAAGAHSELIVLNNYGHSTEGDNRAERAQALRAAVDFLAARLF
jgi:pimeloyl-ACP methyl ester carboxylesterase